MAFDANNPEAIAAIEAAVSKATEGLATKNRELLTKLASARKSSEIDPATVTALENQVEELTGKLTAAERLAKDATKAREAAEAKARADTEAKLKAESEAKARAEAEAKRKLAEEAARKAREVAEAAKAEAAARNLPPPPEPVDVPLPLDEPVKIQAGGQRGRKAGLRTVTKYIVTDYAAALAHVKDHPDVRAAVEKVAAAQAKAGASVPGIETQTEQVAA